MSLHSHRFVCNLSPVTRLSLFLAVAVVGLAAPTFTQADTIPTSFRIIDGKTKKPIPCRVHLQDGKGKHVAPDGLPFWKDHFVCSGEFQVKLAPGEYSFVAERGPEFNRAKLDFALEAGQQPQTILVELVRNTDMAGKGWYSGDLHIHRAVEDVPLLMQAEDLHIGPVITWWNNRNLWAGKDIPNQTLTRFDKRRYFDVMAGEDEREGGALLYFHLKQPLAITGATREFPSPMKFVQQARQSESVWIDIEKPFWWDAPLWLASGQVDSIGLANNHMCRSRMYESEAWGRPRDARRLPPPRGNGFWTQEIYYHILNCGLRIPPSAGSASGVLPNPVGYNRVYVHVGDDFTYERWWQGLKAGRSFVTNGPLLICRANGQLPGHVFRLKTGQSLTVRWKAELTSIDPVTAIEVIKNGEVLRKVPVGADGEFPVLTFERSGWFLFRAITNREDTFRFASTAPYYVEIGKTPRRISRTSSKFFVDWVAERIARVPAKLKDAKQLNEVIRHHEEAHQFWLRKVAEANAR